MEALLSLVGAGVCNVTIARMLAVLLPQLNLQASIWASKHGIFDAVRVLPCVPEMIQAVATICSNRGSSARLQELLLAAVHLSCVVTDEDAVALTKMMVDDTDLAQLCVQPLWRYMVKYIQETQRMLPNDIVDLLRNASGLAAAACVALLLNQSLIASLKSVTHRHIAGGTTSRAPSLHLWLARWPPCSCLRCITYAPAGANRGRIFAV